MEKKIKRTNARDLKPAIKTGVRLNKEIDSIRPEKRAIESFILSPDPAKTIGSTGRTQGERTETTPKKKASNSSNMKKLKSTFCRLPQHPAQGVRLLSRGFHQSLKEVCYKIQ